MAQRRNTQDNQQDEAPAEVTQDAPAVGTDPLEDADQVQGAELASVPADSPVAGGRTDGPILTAEPHRDADRTSYPVPNDAEPHDPPVRSARPDAGIVAASARGAGQHEPPNPDEYHPDGRPKL